MADMSASKVLRYLLERRRDGLSVKSSNDYLQAIKQFCRWMVADRRMPDNPLAYLSGLNVKTDRRHDRRALSVEEIDRLIKVTAEGKKHHKMAGKERAMLYMLALNTGLRANEVASLTWQSFRLDSPTPTVTVLAAFSKHRRDDILPLRVDLAEQLEQWKDEQNEVAENKVFANFNKRKGADMLKIDLGAAGRPYQDDSGRFADFHSLRHTFITNLRNVPSRVTQALARHGSSAMTDRYTHIGLYDERAALDSLPKLPSLSGNRNDENKVAALKTGTDDMFVGIDKSDYKPAYKKLTKNAFPDTNHSLPVGTTKVQHTQGEAESNDSDKAFLVKQLGVNSNLMSLIGNPKKENWAGLESNQRRLTPMGLQPIPFSRSGTDPLFHNGCWLVYFLFVRPASEILFVQNRRCVYNSF